MIHRKKILKNVTIFNFLGWIIFFFMLERYYWQKPTNPLWCCYIINQLICWLWDTVDDICDFSETRCIIGRRWILFIWSFWLCDHMDSSFMLHSPNKLEKTLSLVLINQCGFTFDNTQTFSLKTCWQKNRPKNIKILLISPSSLRE